MAKATLSVRIVSILIAAVTILGFVLVGLMGVTGARTAMSINIGSVNSQVVGGSESISVPVSLRNPGPLSLNGIKVAITILDTNGTLLSQGGGGPLSLSPGSSGQLPISILFDLNRVPESTLAAFATTSENLTLRASLQASVPSLIGFSGTINTPYQWGAPVSNLQLGALTTSPNNSTSVKFNLPFSFTDSSQNFGVSGTVAGAILGQSGNTVGTISSQGINVGTETQYSGQLSGFISQTALSQKTVTVQLAFQTSFGTFTEDVV